MASEPEHDLISVGDRAQAQALLHPIRLRVLSIAQRPASAAEIARRLGLKRQRVNYHVRALERAGMLKAAGRQRKRNMIEQRYVATARAYVLSPNILGPLAADWRAIEDTASADFMLAVIEQVRSDVSRAADQASADGSRLETLSIKSQFRFRTPAQRSEFARAVREALVAVIARHASPDSREDGGGGRGRRYRLVLACYPVPAEEAAAESKGGRP
jgi:DNA-binding transcriptional ArsR family regulator